MNRSAASIGTMCEAPGITTISAPGLSRPTYDLWAYDRAFVQLLERVQAGCKELAHWWKDHAVQASSSGTKRLHHPINGPICYEYTTFQAHEDFGLKLAVYLPATQNAPQQDAHQPLSRNMGFALG
ncbi:MmyB family transcriptional regulator [Nguyenibacter vanlangensis]|nr:hypothetical protein [Nguyenibacter vanlangensis]